MMRALECTCTPDSEAFSGPTDPSRSANQHGAISTILSTLIVQDESLSRTESVQMSFYSCLYHV